ncbi:RidA family protein [Oceanibacterium hippocampi]|uniref:Endoribonuclease L-PSP n=1 Tax=Oceanibacterium hippocampi TaxID=745714 RepID=A0A1Y5SLV4_9PROT|nr:RidA family protein [Oceanibacterium hippocampi]SLN43722.1 Endoribonuclease L-PSP [Oceanibacterium hippocampi]
MTDTVEARLKEAGLSVPEAAAPAANYVPVVRTGNLLFISGQIPLVNGEVTYKGKVGRDFTTEEAQACARLVGLNIIGQAKAALDGDLGRVRRVVKLGGFVNCTDDYTDQPKVINGASDLMVLAFGDAGRHARFAVGTNALPLGIAVEIDAVIEVD